MTAFLVGIVAVTNLALGYLLAIYLDKVGAPWAAATLPRSASTGNKEVGQADDAEAELAAAADGIQVADDQVAEKSIAAGGEPSESTAVDAAPADGPTQQAQAAQAEQSQRTEPPLEEETTLADAEALRTELAKLKQAAPADEEAVTAS